MRRTFSIKIIICQYHTASHFLVLWLEGYLMKFEIDSYIASRGCNER